MKTNFNIRKITGLLMASVLLSCQDVVTYDENIEDEFASNGAPSIETIYAVKDQQTPISSGKLEQIIVIKGANLSNVTEILFNDVSVNLKEVYATSKAAYVPIPRNLPSEINNILKYTTRLGSVSTDFVVQIPSLVISGLYNEFTPAGEKVDILGNYFDLYGFGTDAVKVDLNGEILEISDLSATQFSVTIPKTAADNTKMTLQGEKFAQVKLPYRSTDAIFWNFDKPSEYGFWAGTQYITDGSAYEDPKPLNGSFIRIKNTFSAWSWNNLPCGGFNLGADIAANPADYYFKFEVNNKTTTPFVNTSNGGGYIFQLNGGDYRWNPSANVTFSTYGNWRTVSIPLEDIATNGLNAGWTNLFIILQPNSEWVVDHSFANFRIEKK